MARVSMQMVGLDRLEATLRRTPERVRAALEKAVAQTAVGMAQRARTNVPVETGALKQAIQHTAKGLVGGVVINAGTFNGRRPETYWRFVEFGSIHNPSFRPFLRPAADAETPTVEARLRTAASQIEREWSQ